MSGRHDPSAAERIIINSERDGDVPVAPVGDSGHVIGGDGVGEIEDVVFSDGGQGSTFRYDGKCNVFERTVQSESPQRLPLSDSCQCD